MFTLQAVRKRYGSHAAVDGMDLALRPGQTLALIGSSGSGKSTLLRLMLGLETPDEGRVLFRNEPVDERSVLQVRQQVGYVIQEGGLFPHLSGADNVALLADHLGWPEPRKRARLDELCALTRLDADLLLRRPGQLSGGQRQRVALMRALMLDPEVVLLDEPLGALDPLIRHDLQQELKRIFGELGKTVVLVTHDLNEAAYLAHELVLLQDGRVAQRGSLAELRDAPASDFVRRFLVAQRGLSEASP